MRNFKAGLVRHRPRGETRLSPEESKRDPGDDARRRSGGQWRERLCHSPVTPFVGRNNVAEAQRWPLTTYLPHGGKSRVEKQKRDASRRRGNGKRQEQSCVFYSVRTAKGCLPYRIWFRSLMPPCARVITPSRRSKAGGTGGCLAGRGEGASVLEVTQCAPIRTLKRQDPCGMGQTVCGNLWNLWMQLAAQVSLKRCIPGFRRPPALPPTPAAILRPPATTFRLATSHES